ncbi:MAG TPA: transglycosylase SLT domain-containing protein [Opitutales bacterium]|nr:transglycosylase SLT domain-containing protein [Opitutales bacterium]
MFYVDKKALWSRTGLSMLGGILLLCLLLLILTDCSRQPKYIDRGRVWKVVQKEAEKQGLDPHVVFAIVAAESSFNAHAKNGDAFGLMQLRPPAWKTVSKKPHRRAWNWRENIVVGTAYLGHLKEFLEDHGQFSYPMLAACYRHGPYRVKGVGFDLAELPPPRNKIYQALQRGERAPVSPKG